MSLSHPPLVFQSADEIPADMMQKLHEGDEPIADGWAVSEALYFALFAARGYEWVNGTLRAKPVKSFSHNQLIALFIRMFEAFLEYNPIAVYAFEKFVMKTSAMRTYREPDMLIIRHDNRDALTPTMMRTGADICIEIASPSTQEEDRGVKFQEYEASGVREYWMPDQSKQQTLFYRLDEQGSYQEVFADADGRYRTPLLPGFALLIEWLWRDPAPSYSEVGRAARVEWEAYQASRR